MSWQRRLRTDIKETEVKDYAPLATPELENRGRDSSHKSRGKEKRNKDG